MPTLTQARPQKSGFVIPADLEEAEYPPEVVEKWNKIFEEAKTQLAAGELRPMTVEEFAAQEGIRFYG